jgi:hypothetical protein
VTHEDFIHGGALSALILDFQGENPRSSFVVPGNGGYLSFSLMKALSEV